MPLARPRLAPVALLALTALAACASAPPESTAAGPAFLEDLPEGLAEAAAPGQPMDRIIIDAADGCYWFEYVGRVETTFLPLRTAAGRPICSR